MIDDDLLEALATFARDPLGFVLWAFPWGEPGELETSRIEDWQAEILTQVGQGLLTLEQAILVARTSGHGIGKSACVSWLLLWAMSTAVDTVGVVTANTENQLKTKTWVQLATWYRRCLCKSLFKLTATALFSVDPEHEKTWRIDMVPWSERNTEAFAGLHNKGRRIIVVFDEASAIPDVIWEVTEGALTDEGTEIIWAAFGNPTKNTGRFRECFPGGLFSHRWKSAAIDSRSVTLTNKDQIQRWLEDYGEDSDFFRVRVKGVFPRIDATSFIPLQVAREAVNRTVEPQYVPVVLGVDVGRFGDDPSVLYARRGRDASSIPPEVYLGLDLVSLAARVIDMATRIGAAIVFVDAGGVGGGLVDMLRRSSLHVIAVDFGAKPDGTNEVNRQVKYLNKRAEIWGGMRDWLSVGSIIGGIGGFDLVAELTTPTYSMNDREMIVLESKKQMRARGLTSPNVADALACTFAFPAPGGPSLLEDRGPTVIEDYNPFTHANIYGKEYA